MRYIYLHGFASGPGSRKAVAMAEAFSRRQLILEIPALDGEDFENLTISSQLAILEDTLQNEPACLIGSSMGGYLAAFYASRHPEVARVVLLAPAFNFIPRWLARADPEGNWHQSGWLDVYHYGSKSMRRLHFGLIEDARRYPGMPDFTQPGLILHGIRDETVPVEESRAFLATHQNCRLREFDSGHELSDVLTELTAETLRFLSGSDPTA